MAAAKADVGKYQTMFGYTQITAPFDGVITAAIADPGALIQAGTRPRRAAQALVRLSDNYRLRLDFPVSVEYVKDIHLGDQVTVRVSSLGGKDFTGKITRFTGKVNRRHAHHDHRNRGGESKLEMVPGMYHGRRFKSRAPGPGAGPFPSEAVSQSKASVTVDLVDTNNKLKNAPVTLGLETPNRYEVISGLKEGDRVTIGNHSAIAPGLKAGPQPWAGAQTKWSVPNGE